VAAARQPASPSPPVSDRVGVGTLQHVGMRGPLPPGGNINTSGLPQRAQFKVLGVSPIA